MKTKSLAVILTAAAVTAAAATSCSMKSTMTVSGYGIYMTGSLQGHSDYVVLDDSTLVFTTGSSVYSMTSGTRCCIYWTYDSEQAGKDPMTVEMTGYDALMQTKAFLSNRPDTLGTAPADMYFSGGYPYLWKIGGVYNTPVMLSLGFQYAASTSSTASHYIYMTYTDDPVDADNYFHLNFTHKADADTLGNCQSLCAFTLPESACADGVRGVVLKFPGIGTGRTATYYRLTYATGETEEIDPE